MNEEKYLMSNYLGLDFDITFLFRLATPQISKIKYIDSTLVDLCEHAA
jgi:hypothetical protein